MDIAKRVERTIEKFGLIQRGDRILLAVSGGSDSMTMTDILYKLKDKLGITLFCAHVNHNIREEADLDENFVKEYCKERGIECFIKSVKVLDIAKNEGISSELVGRNERYAFFEELMKQHNINKIATAHNKNDSAESILLHLTRGCGIEGMSGISAIREGYIIRPLIEIKKSDIEGYCKENGIKYVTDKTNFETDYTRNKIRLSVIPQIEKEINPAFCDTICENSVIFKEANEFIEKYADLEFEKVVKDGFADLELLSKEENAISRCIIQRMYSKYTKKSERLSFKYTDSILNIIKSGATSKTINLPQGISARIEYGRLYLTDTKKNSDGFEYSLEIGKEIYVSEANMRIITKKEDKIGKNTKDKIYFCIEKDCELSIRSRRQGDIFMPSGMRGRKRISDLFSDMKIPKEQRDKVPILTDGKDIIWVMGIRTDRRFDKGQIIVSCEIKKENG